MQIKYNNVVAYTVSYNGDGAVSKVVDDRSGITTEYEYDSLGRLIHATERVTDTNEVVLGTQNRFDSYGRPLASIYALPSQSIVSNVGYLPNSSLISRYTVTDSNNSLTRTYTYDSLQRVTSVSTMLNDYSTLQESYTYVSNGTRTSSLVATHTVDGVTYSYTYDNLGNITSVSENGTLRANYYYDTLGQLREVLYYSDRYYSENYFDSYEYNYDKSGNITNVSHYYGPDAIYWEDNTYSYSNTAWGDLLTNYNGTTIAYEPAGNPLNWRNADTIEWYGRQMSMFSNTNGTVTYYTYNADGIRTEKQSCDINGSNAGTVKYTLDGSKIVAENRNGTNLYYLYDDNGAIMGIGYGNNTYTFAKNIQGDVIGIYSGGTLLAKYEYNAYGQIMSITNASGTDISNNATHIANINPFRYRGYYYDNETGFYYVSSRYYDPEIGRWISPEPNVYNGEFDEGAGLIGYNVYAYCANNPVNNIDPTGEFVISTAVLIGIGIGALIGGTAGGVYGYKKAVKNNVAKQDRWKYVVGYGLGGTVVGGVIGGFVGYGVGFLCGATSTSGVALKAISKALSSISQKTWGHIITKEHAWNLVLKNVTQSGVKNLISQALKKGATTLIDKMVKKGVTSMIYESVYSYMGQKIIVHYAVIDGVIRISDAWVKTR